MHCPIVAMHGVIEPKPRTPKLPLSFQRTTVPPEQSSDRRGLVILGGIAVAATMLLVIGDLSARRDAPAETPAIASEPPVTDVAQSDQDPASNMAWDSATAMASPGDAEEAIPAEAETSSDRLEEPSADEPLEAEPVAEDTPAQAPSPTPDPTTAAAPSSVVYDAVVTEPPGPYVVAPTISPPYVPAPTIQRPSPVPAPSIQRPSPVPAPSIPRPATMQPTVPTAVGPVAPTAVPVRLQPPNIIRP